MLLNYGMEKTLGVPFIGVLMRDFFLCEKSL
jgi:hypothetical protein